MVWNLLIFVAFAKHKKKNNNECDSKSLNYPKKVIFTLEYKYYKKYKNRIKNIIL